MLKIIYLGQKGPLLIWSNCLLKEELCPAQGCVQPCSEYFQKQSPQLLWAPVPVPGHPHDDIYSCFHLISLAAACARCLLTLQWCSSENSLDPSLYCPLGNSRQHLETWTFSRLDCLRSSPSPHTFCATSYWSHMWSAADKWKNARWFVSSPWMTVDTEVDKCFGCRLSTARQRHMW